MNLDRSKLFLFMGIVYLLGGIGFLVGYLSGSLELVFLFVSLLFLFSGTFNIVRYKKNRQGK